MDDVLEGTFKIECSEVVTKFSVCRLQKIIPLKYEPNIQNQSVMTRIATIFKGSISVTLIGKKGGSFILLYGSHQCRKSCDPLGTYIIVFCCCYHQSEQQSRKLARTQQM